MPGPRPKPTHLKLLQGNPGHRPLPVDEPMPDGALVEPPAHLNAIQQRIWRESLANAPEGLMRRLDSNVLARFCVAQSIFEDANEKVTRLGSIVNGPGNVPMHNPYLSVLNRQSGIMRQCSDELGFSPAARTRVKVAPKRKAKSALGKLRELRID
jgi:P27 family predicted phage terminase small subunit